MANKSKDLNEILKKSEEKLQAEFSQTFHLAEAKEFAAKRLISYEMIRNDPVGAEEMRKRALEHMKHAIGFNLVEYMLEAEKHPSRPRFLFCVALEGPQYERIDQRFPQIGGEEMTLRVYVEERWCSQPSITYEFAIRLAQKRETSDWWRSWIEARASKVAEEAWQELLSKSPVFGALKRRSLKRINWARHWFVGVVTRAIVRVLASKEPV